MPEAHAKVPSTGLLQGDSEYSSDASCELQRTTSYYHLARRYNTRVLRHPGDDMVSDPQGPARGESLLLGVVPTSRVDDENRADRRAAHLVIGTVLAVVAIWGVLLALYGSAFPNAFSDRQEVWGQFGDFVGGVLNPILGTLTLGGVVYTIALQRRLLSDTRAIAQSQRIVDQHQAFEPAVFHLMGAIDRRGSEARLVLDGSTVASMKTDTPYTRPYMLKGGDREGTTGEFTFHGHDAFHAILAKISWEVLTTIPGARQRGDDIASFRRITALRELEAYDYAVGPSMRQALRRASVLPSVRTDV